MNKTFYRILLGSIVCFIALLIAAFFHAVGDAVALRFPGIQFRGLQFFVVPVMLLIFYLVGYFVSKIIDVEHDNKE